MRIKNHAIPRRQKSISNWDAVLIDHRLPGKVNGVGMNYVFAPLR